MNGLCLTVSRRLWLHWSQANVVLVSLLVFLRIVFEPLENTRCDNILGLISRNFCLELWGRSLPSLLASPAHLGVWRVLLRRFCSCLLVRAGLWDLDSPSAKCFSGELAGWLPLDRPGVSSPLKYREWFSLCLSPEAW